MSALDTISVDRIRANPAALREVNRNSEKFLELVESVRTSGVLQPICVRELPDPEIPGQKIYGLIDGLHRFTASKEAGKTTIPALITSMDDGEVEEAQIIANIHRIETKPVEYSKGLLRVLARNPLMTESELAARLAKSPSWLKERLNLVKLGDDLQKLVDENTINLSNAYTLAKLPQEEQKDFADRAQTMPPAQFSPLVNARVKEIKDAQRQGRPAGENVFQPVAHLRKMPEIRTECETGAVGATLLAKFNVTSVTEAFALALKWVTNMDPDSIEVQKAEDEKRKAAAADAKAKAAAEREAKKQKEAAEKLAAL